MTLQEFRTSLEAAAPPGNVTAPLAGLWWDAKVDWVRAHELVDELESKEGMAVHAYLHRKEGDASNAACWYAKAGREQHRPTLEAEWTSLADWLLS